METEIWISGQNLLYFDFEIRPRCFLNKTMFEMADFKVARPTGFEPVTYGKSKTAPLEIEQ
jgi:hypothetical protein